ncbi:MAG TPA: hypothetical protein VIX37_05765 [Candidatus Sulfotelmatobacter sp.]
MQNLDDETVIHLGDDAGKVTCLLAFAKQERQKTADARVCAGQILRVGLRFHKARDATRRLSLQHHQIVGGEHTSGSSLLCDQHMMNVAAHHREQGVQ